MFPGTSHGSSIQRRDEDDPDYNLEEENQSESDYDDSRSNSNEEDDDCKVICSKGNFLFQIHILKANCVMHSSEFFLS